MNKFLKSIAIATLIMFSPIIALAQGVFVTNGAQTACSGTGIGKMICQAQVIINSIVPVLIALGVVYFVWGVVTYLVNGGDEEAKKKGRDRIVYGIIGFAVIVGLWGLVNVVVNTFGLGGQVNAPALVTVTAAESSGGVCPDPSTNIQTFLGFFTCVINNSVIPLIFAVAIVMFIWGVVQFFILNSDEEAKRAQGKQFMIWGVIALAVMLSVWGLVAILGATFGLNKGASALPGVHPPTSSTSN